VFVMFTGYNYTTGEKLPVVLNTKKITLAIPRPEDTTQTRIVLQKEEEFIIVTESITEVFRVLRSSTQV
jgi:hypothetical protein